MSHLVISHPRSGLTWLRWMGRAAARRLGLGDLFSFTHDGMGLRRTSVYTYKCRLARVRNPWGNPRVIFLLRDPLDMLWSNWNLLKIGTLSEFLRSKSHGIEPYVSWLLWWHIHRAECKELHVFSYEGFKRNPVSELERFLSVLGHKLPDSDLHEIVEECSFANMFAYEKKHGRVLPDVQGPSIRSGIIGESTYQFSYSSHVWAREQTVKLLGTFAGSVHSQEEGMRHGGFGVV
jgi:hypothetical protein